MSMLSPADILAELDRLEFLRNASPNPGPNRRFERYSVRGTAILQPVCKQGLYDCNLEVQLRDVSRGGVGFLATELMVPFGFWQMSFIRDDLKIGEQEIIVRHCQQVSDGLYLAGAEFVVSSGLLNQIGVPATTVLSDISEGRDHEDDQFSSIYDLEG